MVLPQVKQRSGPPPERINFEIPAAAVVLLLRRFLSSCFQPTYLLPGKCAIIKKNPAHFKKFTEFYWRSGHQKINSLR